jgi:predicted ATPase/DNA-binding CsgD family transcriptional regulator
VLRTLESSFLDGGVFVRLESVRDPCSIAGAIAAALGLKRHRLGFKHEELIESLQDRQILVVLDNFEQIAAAAPFVANLLTACPRLQVMVTSRVRLRLSLEHVIQVRPLCSPSATMTLSELQLNSAIQLFKMRAMAVESDFELTDDSIRNVAAICRRLDGLPLAIELAAAWAQTLTPAAILERLNMSLQLLKGGPSDAPTRQRSLRESISWSSRMVAPKQAALLRRLSVFAGGFTLEAAEAVCLDRRNSKAGAFSQSKHMTSDEIALNSVLEDLDALVNHSLVRHEPNAPTGPRYAMLETTRAFALAELKACEEQDEFCGRHALWCLNFATQARALRDDESDTVWLRRLDAEMENIRVALAWLHDHGYADAGCRLFALLDSPFVGQPPRPRGKLWHALLANRPRPVIGATEGVTLLARVEPTIAEGDERIASGQLTSAFRIELTKQVGRGNSEVSQQPDAVMVDGTAGEAQEASRHAFSESSPPYLSPRRRQVLVMMAVGCKDREIGEALGISERTVETHVAHILDRLGGSNRTAAVATAVRLGLVWE